MNSKNVWDSLIGTAVSAGLDQTVFGETHHAIVDQVIAFLNTSTSPNKSFGRWFRSKRPPIQPISPIIICGVPGTGKTTFLYALDIVLRHHLGLPDKVTPTMTKPTGRTYDVYKRSFNGNQLVSLLSMNKWAEMLHFYAWDTTQHRLDNVVLQTFIRDTLYPMRVIFADEVEMVGYAPTLPDLAKNGILVVGTSNQTTFRQLEHHAIPAQLYHINGHDMRAGDPADAVVNRADPLWDLFVQTAKQPVELCESITFQRWQRDQKMMIMLDFPQAMTAAMLSSQWLDFLQKKQTSTQTLTLLLDDFSLETLRTNYDGIIRFVALFDAIEQLAIGVLIRNIANTPQLSREAINHMQVTIETTSGVPDEIKRRVVAGIDRCSSRLGQAGHQARYC